MIKCFQYYSLGVEKKQAARLLSLPICLIIFIIELMSRPQIDGENLTILIVFLIIAPVIRSQYSPLRLGEDSNNNDIKLSYLYNSHKSTSSYYLIFYSAMQFSSNFYMCFRQRPIINHNNSTCSLLNQTGNFDCLNYQEVKSTNATAPDLLQKSFSKFILNYDYTIKSNFTRYFPWDTLQDPSIVSFTLSGFDNEDYKLSQNGSSKIPSTFSFISKPKAIYEVITFDNLDLSNPSTNIDRNYAITFFQLFSANSQNLFTQRQVLCYSKSTIINLIFLGGTIRNGQNYYFAAFLNYNTNNTHFLIWEGLSFSKNKVQRDMVGVYPSQGKYDDLMSLYASAPFLDVSTNINGFESWELITQSGNTQTNDSNWFYFTQIGRNYDTGDTYGDQKLVYKMNNQYCFAAYITSPVKNIEYLYTNKNYKHQILQCFRPDLSLHAVLLHLTPLLLIYLAL